jgi:hypothetical protein
MRLAGLVARMGVKRIRTEFKSENVTERDHEEDID